MGRRKVTPPKLVRYAARRMEAFGHDTGLDLDLGWNENAVHWKTGKPLTAPRTFLLQAAADLEDNVDLHMPDSYSPAEIRRARQGVTTLRKIARMGLPKLKSPKLKRLP